MKAYLALTSNELRLAFRDKQVLFFNYAFPLIFFFLLSAMLHAERGGSTISVIVTNVLVCGDSRLRRSRRCRSSAPRSPPGCCCSSLPSC